MGQPMPGRFAAVTHAFDAYRCQQANGTECLSVYSRFTRKATNNCSFCNKKLLVRLIDNTLVKKDE